MRLAGIRPPQKNEEAIDVLQSVLPAFLAWRNCRKPFSVGMGTVPMEVETSEIAAVAEVHQLELTPMLLMQIRHLDQHYVNERIKQINAKTTRG